MKFKGIGLGVILVLFSFALYGQSDQKEEQIENIEENVEAVQENFYENREKLKAQPISFLKGLDSELSHVNEQLEAVEEGRIPVADSSKKDSARKSKKVRISVDGEEISFDWPQEDECAKKKCLPDFKTSYLNLGIGFNNYLHKNDFDLPNEHNFLKLNGGKSINVKLTFVKMGVNLIDHHLSMLTGLGIDYNNYRFSQNTVLTSTGADTLATQTFSDSYDKYKLATQYAFVPLELRFESNPVKPEKSFRVALGGRVGYLIKSYTKLKRNDGDKVKDFGNFNLSQYKIGGIMRIGFGKTLNFYANYDVTPLFADDVKPSLTPVAVGLNIIGFHWND